MDKGKFREIVKETLGELLSDSHVKETILDNFDSALQKIVTHQIENEFEFKFDTNRDDFSAGDIKCNNIEGNEGRFPVINSDVAYVEKMHVEGIEFNETRSADKCFFCPSRKNTITWKVVRSKEIGEIGNLKTVCLDCITDGISEKKKKRKEKLSFPKKTNQRPAKKQKIHSKKKKAQF